MNDQETPDQSNDMFGDFNADGSVRDNGQVYDPPPNAAYLLASYLTQWAVPEGRPAQEPRGIYLGAPPDTWRNYADAVNLVRRVHDELRGLAAAGQSVRPWDDALGQWYEAAYMASAPWDSAQGAPRGICPSWAISSLEQLGLLLGMRQRTLAIKSAGDREELRQKLSEVRDLLRTEPDLFSEDIRSYLWRLVDEAERVVDTVQHIGDEAARDLMYRFGGVFAAEATKQYRAGHTERAGWLSKLGWYFFGSASGEAGKAAWELGEGGLRALGG
ncbi:hypothetical protein [Nocardioides lentus]|uniref:hypothetical protein n=1 Tax=Nocardioides lentus TaxID=338077 RepID=UPI0031E25CE4